MMMPKFATAIPLALAAMAVSVGASAQESAWGYFEDEAGVLQAGVQTPDGRQLILKCNAPGERSVFAVLYTPAALGAPSTRANIRDIQLQYDNGPPVTRRWRYYQFTVEAVNTRRDQELPPFLQRLADVQNLKVRLTPVDGAPQSIEFNVSGAREAIGRVYESCRDSTNPLG
ncbi:hypothetical protein [Alteraurantiacibacter palmitatis]|uniref:Uncharacterized protein n=1 Tax=Alteraurantiacibacter palmitatis TaxID=2054628 RepID=A0ABV7EB50_9SPHN